MVNKLFEIILKLKNGIFTSKRININKNLIFLQNIDFSNDISHICFR